MQIKTLVWTEIVFILKLLFFILKEDVVGVAFVSSSSAGWFNGSDRSVFTKQQWMETSNHSHPSEDFLDICLNFASHLDGNFADDKWWLDF